jgi:hypothetical protein
MASEGVSAPEAFVLLSLPRYDAAQVLKIGFMGLIAQGVLRLETEDRPGLIRTRHIPHVTVADGVPADLPPIAASLVKVVRAAGPGGTMKNLIRESRREYGGNLLGFVLKHIGPSLAARGWAEDRRIRLLGLIPTHRFERTAAGDAEKIRLDAAMREARAIPQYLDNDPAQVAALAAAVGGAILLVEELRPFYGRLSRALRSGGDVGYLAPDSNDFGDGGQGFATCDLGGIDFSCFDAGAFDSFDSGFSGASSDSGSSGC